jgi:hypothetical protein
MAELRSKMCRGHMSYHAGINTNAIANATIVESIVVLFSNKKVRFFFVIKLFIASI